MANDRNGDVSLRKALMIHLAALPLFAGGAIIGVPLGVFVALRRRDTSALTDYPFIKGVQAFCFGLEFWGALLDGQIPTEILYNLEDRPPEEAAKRRPSWDRDHIKEDVETTLH